MFQIDLLILRRWYIYRHYVTIKILPLPTEATLRTTQQRPNRTFLAPNSYRGYTVRYTARGQKRLQKFLMGSPQQQQKRNCGPSPPRRWQFRRPASKLLQCIVVQCLLLLLMVLPWLVGCCPDLLLCCCLHRSWVRWLMEPFVVSQQPFQSKLSS